MASINTDLIGNTRFVGSPITVYVTAGSPANATFHRVRLTVTVPSGSSGTPFEFSTPVTSGQTVQFDISSAFRAFADSHHYEADALNRYVNLSASLAAYDDYLVDGEEHTGTGEAKATVSGLYAGALSDWERLTGTLPARYSRKPTTSPEICFVGYQHLAPVALVSGISINAPAVSTVTVAAGATVPAGSPAGSKGIYGIPAPADGYELRFINSLGVHENVFVTGLPAEEVTMQTERYVISRQETLTEFSRGLVVKQNDHLRLKLSTGPLDRQWQHWYIHELLMARWAWIAMPNPARTDGLPLYVPCHLLPDDTIPSRDRQKAAPLTVQFTAELDINGSPLL